MGRCAKPIASGGHQSRPRERAPAQDRVRMRTPSPARSPTPTDTQRSGSRRAEKALDIPVDQPSKGARQIDPAVVDERRAKYRAEAEKYQRTVPNDAVTSNI